MAWSGQAVAAVAGRGLNEGLGVIAHSPLQSRIDGPLVVRLVVVRPAK